MDYILDTSALIRAWNEWYRIENFPDIWNGLEHLAENSVLTIPDAVLLELLDQANDLGRWCKDREDLIINPSDQEIQEIVKQIGVDFPGLKNASMPRKTNFADPFVIATAHHLDAAVVSNEEPTGKLSGPKIPDVCKEINIRHLMFHRIVRDQGWTFRAS